ncbi:Bug family tripartite tricarboxylate transporter substrate binding protein [Falsiroseomonas sp. CW058]|uniref:Bug family tripartite tricarboxylate transporter substrate binding protein n=1 Tax=Falsiroseomonas sp. CW058 TaxID=3388664 RepID=UPI003D322C56
MTVPLTRRAALGLALTPALARTGAAQAPAPWRPNRPIRMVVPTAAAGANDVMARIAAQFLAPRLGQPVVVDNRAGAGGTIGTMDVLRSPPDGHTLLMGNIGAQSIAYSLARNMPYGPDDLVPISNMFTTPHVLVVHPTVPATTLRDFVALLRDSPDKYSYGTPGIGQSPHLAAVWFNQVAQTRSVPVHYRGTAPANTDLIAGNIHFVFDLIANHVESIRAGRVRAIAVTGPERSPLMPELPTMREAMAEFATFSTGSWIGLLAAKGTPEAAIRTLNAEMRDLLTSPETAQRFLALGGTPAYGAPEEFGAFLRAETAKWAEVIRREGLQVDLT